jgi:hypothetical protein
MKLGPAAAAAGGGSIGGAQLMCGAMRWWADSESRDVHSVNSGGYSSRSTHVALEDKRQSFCAHSEMGLGMRRMDVRSRSRLSSVRPRKAVTLFLSLCRLNACLLFALNLFSLGLT